MTADLQSVEPLRLGVVVAVRNAARTLGHALASICDEIVRLGEIPDTPALVDTAPIDTVLVDTVVVDGGSTDSTVAVAHSFDGVRVVRQSGIGLAQARNEGVHLVEGDLIAFLDGDDRWLPGSLASRLRALQESPRALAVVGHMATEALPAGEIPARHRESLGVPRPGYTPGALVARRTAFDVIGAFDETLTLAADSEWFVRARTHGHEILLIDDVVLRKGVRIDSLSTDVALYRRELLDVSRRFLEERRRPT